MNIRYGISFVCYEHKNKSFPSIKTAYGFEQSFKDESAEFGPPFEFRFFLIKLCTLKCAYRKDLKCECSNELRGSKLLFKKRIRKKLPQSSMKYLMNLPLSESVSIVVVLVKLSLPAVSELSDPSEIRSTF
ncbi:hypothetical protein DERP_005877 [Dermatophagoides pteronyssinus]|uniref:Uncharacterized protein n=1 Tax=Dermatophagoides pteronyssinus TaxID=6956 RepID=A0ABQ8JAI1_DERPT|nr:hypothetical protein DERP_005877 [Dermatophagoides pteronyssinus]